MGYFPHSTLEDFSSASVYSAGSSASVHAPKVVDPDCDLCVPDCEDETCAAAEKCTDDCFVVPCDDPSHTESSCGCELEEEDNYYGPGLDNLFGDSAPIPSSSAFGPPTSSFAPQSTAAYHLDHPHSWDAALAAFLCESCGDVFPPTFLQSDSPPQSETTSYSSPSLSHASDAFYSSVSSPTTAPQASQHLLQTSPFFDFTSPGPSNPPSQATTNVTCMWAGCHAQFSTLEELVGHVNLLHLRPGTTQEQPAAPTPSSLSCQWDDCHNYSLSQTTAGPSSGATLDVLQEHLYHDHLGIEGLHQQSPFFMDTSPQIPSSSPTFSLTSSASTLKMPRHPQSTTILSEPSSSSASTSSSSTEMAPVLSAAARGKSVAPTEKEEENAICRWKDCGIAFSNTEDLTTHLTAEHVGGGKAHYECYWADCQRHGDHGFTSKQKICRHLQSHTGHRPFQCKLCKQNFSEAATLQQHMRRHTQEKPYVCDVPGCGKAFAIAGALTIHKRTHNGDKPFKCTYCDRAFSESSNLSKHLRTHTGVRPYVCSEPGCSKAFSRPDQLARHQSVHRK
ncbi:unnamed protein product [Peniophora sp. CBMAI 1063]|nr:unnamed protein product [Peniophora sp. CBMAI 1063]